MHVSFVDVVDKGSVGTVATFRTSDIATLSRTRSHLIQFSIEFKDGAANDQVKAATGPSLLYALLELRSSSGMSCTTK